MKKLLRNPLFVISGILFVAGGILLGHTFSVKAQNSGPNVIGAAWASTPGMQGEGVGWIALDNSTGGNYGLTINPADATSGNISGQGWSEHVGWLNFDPTGGFPVQSGNWPVPATLVVPGNQAQFPGTTLGDIVGWAKFEPLDGNSGGWDGWVAMRGVGQGTSFGVRITGDFTSSNNGDYCVSNSGLCPFGGYAWGDIVAGWIDFSYADANLDNVPVALELCSLDGSPNGVDEDGDGLVDEICTTGTPEICDNGIDDDNDGSIDEGCGNNPPAQELCNNDGTPNGVDEDGDGAYDEGCQTLPGEICWNVDTNGNYIDDNQNGMVNEGCLTVDPTICSDGVENEYNPNIIDDCPNPGGSINPIYQEI